MAAVDKYNVESAEILANSALHLPITQAAPIYEQLLSIFPTAAKYWRQYVEAQMAVNNDDATKQIFSRCLLNCLQIPLWRCYIRFIRKVNDKKGVEGQEETRKAFDFMLGYVGADIGSGPVWMEYIAFLKSLPHKMVLQAANTQEESQRMTAVRKAYQKAIVTPTHHVEQLWKDYENFENSVSRQLAKGLLSEYQPKYNSARAVYRERKKYVDEIDWNMLAVPPTDSCKEEMQWMTWKRLLAFEKGNPQRIDSASSNKRIIFTYEQCLMYLYHYPDIWYDYATWHAKSGSMDAATKVFQRALKALPDSEMLKYAYAELEESRGAIQSAKKLYESPLGNGADTTALAHIQFIRFIRRTEGVEAARKYFLDARKTPTCTYHVYVAYALMAFCLDKDPKVAHNVFEAGLKHFMHEPAYILEYADFLSCLNDDRNIRALFERALSSLPQEESIEVWKQFTQFEQTYGDLASMLKVEQRRKEALSGKSEEAASVLESSLQDVVARYSFKDLWPCTSKDLDHLSRQEWLAKNIGKKVEKSAFSNGSVTIDKNPSAPTSNSTASVKVLYPDISQMVVYDPRQHSGTAAPPNTTAPAILAASNPLSNPTISAVDSGSANAFDEVLKATPPALVAFLTNLPALEGPKPNVDIVLSICLQSDLPTGQTKKLTALPSQRTTGPAPSTSDLSGSSKSHPIPSSSSFRPRDRHLGKRKDLDRQEEDETTTVQSQPLPRDVFRIRQIQKARGGSASQTGSVSYGSALSGDLSGSTY
ncbi:Tetratricopeptide repeat-like superfamily protein isoform 1 [Theobroma cacao]|uniref:Tetratricopeptide repeat-like superfamily protein isoform 1 n=1 Tax=Theobroma cacao TaxID=3641 RepID=A0A061FQQ9_THECC|nr:Tetratricopeptide repeat-like superfamily protein isoform 1 [Theobroma cacao]